MKAGFWTDYRDSFRSPYGWIMWYVTFWGLVVTAVLVWLAIGLFEAETTHDQILYATGCVAAMLVVTMIKVVSWMMILRVAFERRMEELLGRRDAG